MSGAAQYPIGPFVQLEPYAMPLAIPSGSETWEASVLMLPTEEETARITVKLRASARIVQFRPSVAIIGDSTNPSTELAEQFWVAIDIDDRTQLSTAAATNTNAPQTGNFVTAASYKDRLVNVWAASPTPEIGFRFRSKTPNASGFANRLVLSMTVVGYYVDADGKPLLRKVTA